MRNPNAPLAHLATRKGPLHVDAPSDDDAPLEVGDASLTAVLLARAAVDKIGACAGHARITWYVGQDRGVMHRHTGVCIECVATVQVVAFADGALTVVWRDVGGRGTVISGPPQCRRPETCARPTDAHTDVGGS
jgi:hypothetical protein